MTFRLLTILLLLGISSQRTAAAETLPSTAQEQALFLAGLPLPKQSALYSLQQSSEYRQHQKELQDQWAFCRSIRYENMQQWGRDHLGQYSATRGVLRYLFSGPDFLNAYAFFPDTRVMVLGGLEPVGEVPPPEALHVEALSPALRALRDALHTSLYCGYFITNEMKPQLVQGSFQGVLPVLYTELALTGNCIQSVQMVRPFGSPGVQIIYHRMGGPEQTLYYFKADLSNGKECKNFLAWLGDIGAGCSYLKAASYLLPRSAFSETRNFVLRSSRLILQDDSGIPFRSFLPGDWQIQLFGVYTEPLEIFKLRQEPELEAAYRTALFRGGLPFGAGYHVNANDANLLLAVRTNGHVTADADMLPTQMTAPPAVPAFSAPTPKPTPIRIRKALPVPIRKAIPVCTPKAKKEKKPKREDMPQETVLPAPSATPAPSPQPSMPAPSQGGLVEPPASPITPPEEVRVTESNSPLQPASTMPMKEQPSVVEDAPTPDALPAVPVEPPPFPTTSDGKPID